MSLVLNQDQRPVRESAHRFFLKSAPIKTFRNLRDAQESPSYSAEIWHQLLELGFPTATIPESCGGLGLGYLVLGSILEEAGHTLCASPLFATSVLGASAVELAGSDQQRDDILGRVCSQGLTLGLALDEAGHHDPDNIRTTARKTGDGYVLNGEKRFVIDGSTADELIIVAQLTEPSTSIAMFVIDRQMPGLETQPLRMVDSRGTAHLRFNELKLPSSALLPRSSESVLTQILDRARACLAAEMLGGIDEIFERTLTHLREREQFGVKIGSFQALKHRVARLYTEIELTRSSIMGALSSLDAGAADCSLLCSLAKVRANDTYRLAGNEAIQLHGGIGVTDELDVGLFVKRSRTSMQQFGDSRYLRDRYARLSGY